MTTTELYMLLKERFDLVERPTEEELQEIAKQLLKLSKIKKVNDSDLITIINNTVSKKTIMANESLDMTASMNIAQQIIDKLNK